LARWRSLPVRSTFCFSRCRRSEKTLMQGKDRVRQHAYLMIPQRPSGSARCGAPTGRLWRDHPTAPRWGASAIHHLRTSAPPPRRPDGSSNGEKHENSVPCSTFCHRKPRRRQCRWRMRSRLRSRTLRRLRRQ
jgi:hypothetical protein